MYYIEIVFISSSLKIGGQGMSKNGTTEKFKMGAEYDGFYKEFVETLVVEQGKNLTEKSLRELIKKYKQRLNQLSVVCLDADSSEPLLMYCLGDNIFFEYSYFDRTCGFYIRNGFFKETPLVREVKENELSIFKDSVLKYLTENEKMEKITICSNRDNHWIFKCHYTFCDGEFDDVKSKEAILKVVCAENFQEASKKMLDELSKIKVVVAFFDFELWWNGSFLKILSARKILQGVPLLVNSIKRLDMLLDSFSFMVTL